MRPLAQRTLEALKVMQQQELVVPIEIEPIIPNETTMDEAVALVKEIFPSDEPPAEVQGYACTTCQWRLYKASGLLRCHFKTAVRCSHYIGPHREHHFKLYSGPDWKGSLRRG